MLSQGSKLTEKKRLKALPELERPLTVRLKFRKTGSLQYISHLDLQRTFNRVLVRACLPLWYTKGFNPHAKLVFSTPLSVGAQSIYEFLDIRIDREMPCDEIKDRLNAELTDELYINHRTISLMSDNIDTRVFEIPYNTIDLVEIKDVNNRIVLGKNAYNVKKSRFVITSGGEEIFSAPMNNDIKTEEFVDMLNKRVAKSKEINE